MQQTDVAIVGAGQTGRFIAERLNALGKKVVLSALPGNPEDYLQRVVDVIATPSLGRTVHDANHRNGTSSAKKNDGLLAMTAKTTPHFLNAHTLVVNGEEIQAKRFVIASGCQPRIPDEFKGKKFILPLDLFASNQFPKSATVIGGGAVGVCTAAQLSARGCAVTLVHNTDRLLPQEDEDMASAVMKKLEKMGISIRLNTRNISGEMMILATGLAANNDGLDLKKAGVYAAPSGRVAVDSSMRTSAPHIYAAGAVTGPPFNLSLEKFQAELAADNLFAPFFARRRIFPEPIPRVVPFEPTLASIGLTELEARNKFRDVRAVKISTDGEMIKLVGRRRSGELLGAHLLMAGALELILYFDLLMKAEIPLREVTEAHHYPPSAQVTWVHEAISEWLET